MRVGIMDIDTKMDTERGNKFGRKTRYPNIACGKIFGYHKLQGDEVIYPYKNELVDRLYISTIFTSTKAAIKRLLPYWEQRAGEVIIGGSGWDDYSKQPYNITQLPPEIEAIPHFPWTYEMYNIDYGIGFTTRGCHVGCSFCVVPKKEGMVEFRETRVKDLINPRSRHLVLMNNNSLAHADFFQDIEEIKEHGLSIHWDQANDITLVNDKVAEALASVDYRGFNGTDKHLFFAFDQLIKKKIDPDHGGTVTYDMLKVVPEKVRMLKEYGIPPSHLNFYMLLGFNTTEEEDLARVYLLKELGCDIHPMLFQDLNGRPKVDGNGNPQQPHSSAIRDWVKSYKYRSIPLHEFTKYQKRMFKWNAAQQQLTLF